MFPLLHYFSQTEKKTPLKAPLSSHILLLFWNLPIMKISAWRVASCSPAQTWLPVRCSPLWHVRLSPFPHPSTLTPPPPYVLWPPSPSIFLSMNLFSTWWYVNSICWVSYLTLEVTSTATHFYHCRVVPETLYHRDNALLYIAYVMLIWGVSILADRWHYSLWP